MSKLFQRIFLNKQSNQIVKPSSIIRYNNWYYSSTTVAAIPKIQNVNNSENKTDLKISNVRGSELVRAAFAAIEEQNLENVQLAGNNDFQRLVNNAKTIDELLSVSNKTRIISRQNALKVVSVLSNWLSNNKIKLAEFENDPRFLKFCKILSASNKTTYKRKYENDHLLTAVVAEVTAEDEAARMIQDLTMNQMVKVLSNLSIKRRRLPSLLRTLSYNITAFPENLTIKQSADSLYAISTLNFYDENLMYKICADIILVLRKTALVTKSTILGSILTSIGLMKYKNTALLDAISEWMVENSKLCRSQDIFSLLMTLAVVDYLPLNSEQLFDSIRSHLTQLEAGDPLVWLDIVWSLVLLNQATGDQVRSILNEEFINSLTGDGNKKLKTSAILKLLNIDGAAHYLMKDFDHSSCSNIEMLRILRDKTVLGVSKEKSLLLKSVMDALQSLVTPSNIRSRVNTGLGFCIGKDYFLFGTRSYTHIILDAEFLLNKSFISQPLDSLSTSSTDLYKVAIQIYDYHDICKGQQLLQHQQYELIGLNKLSQRLLSAMGYKVIPIIYMELAQNDKIVNRVKYLETKLKETLEMI